MVGQGSGRIDERLLRIAERLRLEVAGCHALEALDEAGIKAFLLKGPVTNAWLNMPERSYGDLDILVSPKDFSHACGLLEADGLVNQHDYMLPLHRPLHERALQDAWGTIDLHRALGGVSPKQAQLMFDYAWTNQDVMMLMGRRVTVLPQDLRLVHLALHAASSTSTRKAIGELEAALARFQEAEWREAANLARRFHVGNLFAIGVGRAGGDGVALIASLARQSVGGTRAYLIAMGAPLEARTVVDVIIEGGTRGLVPLLGKSLLRQHGRKVPGRTRLSAILRALSAPFWLMICAFVHFWQLASARRRRALRRAI